MWYIKFCKQYFWKYNIENQLDIINDNSLLGEYYKKGEGSKFPDTEAEKASAEYYKNSLINFYRDNIPDFKYSIINILMTATNVDKKLSLVYKSNNLKDEDENEIRNKSIVKISPEGPLSIYNWVLSREGVPISRNP